MSNARVQLQRRTAVAATLAIVLSLGGLVVVGIPEARADKLTCRKAIAPEPSGEGSNALNATRVKCQPGEFLTGGACYPEVRPNADGTCQTSAMAIIQPIAETPDTTEGAFFTCLQTGGTECPVEARTRAMAICCKLEKD